MKYLCLAWSGADERDYDEDACESFLARLRASGRLVVRPVLRAHRLGVVVRPARDRPEVLPAPATPSGQVVSELFVIEARDLNEAIRLVSEHPAARSAGRGGRGVAVVPVERLETGPAWGRSIPGVGHDEC